MNRSTLNQRGNTFLIGLLVLVLIGAGVLMYMRVSDSTTDTDNNTNTSQTTQEQKNTRHTNNYFTLELPADWSDEKVDMVDADYQQFTYTSGAKMLVIERNYFGRTLPYDYHFEFKFNSSDEGVAYAAITSSDETLCVIESSQVDSGCGSDNDKLEIIVSQSNIDNEHDLYQFIYTNSEPGNVSEDIELVRDIVESFQLEAV